MSLDRRGASRPSCASSHRAQLDGTLLGLDDSEPAELAPGARDDPADERSGVGRVLLQEWLGQKVVRRDPPPRR